MAANKAQLIPHKCVLQCQHQEWDQQGQFPMPQWGS